MPPSRTMCSKQRPCPTGQRFPFRLLMLRFGVTHGIFEADVQLVPGEEIYRGEDPALDLRLPRRKHPAAGSGGSSGTPARCRRPERRSTFEKSATGPRWCLPPRTRLTPMSSGFSEPIDPKPRPARGPLGPSCPLGRSLRRSGTRRDVRPGAPSRILSRLDRAARRRPRRPHRPGRWRTSVDPTPRFRPHSGHRELLARRCSGPRRVFRSLP